MMIKITDHDPFFTGVETVDRYIKPLPPHSHKAITCPRCDSSNTKFCYYNNYNLSQPRHFCKSCRRYWTKGGVLRNVPVGGGCRRNTKRSKIQPKPSTNSHLRNEPNSDSQSSSHNSVLTDTTTTSTTNTATAVPQSSILSPSTLIIENERFLVSQTFVKPSFDSVPVDRSEISVKPSFDSLPVDRSEIWPPEIGSFTNLMSSSVLGFNVAEISPYKMNSENENSNQNSNQLCDGMDPTVEIELSRFESRTTDVSFSAVDWPDADQDGVFDLSGNVDDHSYWNHEVDDNPLNYIA